MEYKALSQNTIKIVKEVTINGSIDFTDPLHPICGNIKYTYGSTGTENQGISIIEPVNTETSYTNTTIPFYAGDKTVNKIPSNVIGYEIDGVTYYGIKNACYQIGWSSKAEKYTINGTIKVVKLIPSENAINVEEWDFSNKVFSVSYPYPIYMYIPKQENDLILSITFEPSEE